jgi:hypothetical protein
LSEALAKSYFVLERIKVDALTRIAIADGIDVFLGILGVNGLLLLDGIVTGGGGLRSSCGRAILLWNLRRSLCRSG